MEETGGSSHSFDTITWCPAQQLSHASCWTLPSRAGPDQSHWAGFGGNFASADALFLKLSLAGGRQKFPAPNICIWHVSCGSRCDCRRLWWQVDLILQVLHGHPATQQVKIAQDSFETRTCGPGRSHSAAAACRGRQKKLHQYLDSGSLHQHWEIIFWSSG
jgi:hypothetical protein